MFCCSGKPLRKPKGELTSARKRKLPVGRKLFPNPKKEEVRDELMRYHAASFTSLEQRFPEVLSVIKTKGQINEHAGTIKDQTLAELTLIQQALIPFLIVESLIPNSLKQLDFPSLVNRKEQDFQPLVESQEIPLSYILGDIHGDLIALWFTLKDIVSFSEQKEFIMYSLEDFKAYALNEFLALDEARQHHCYLVPKFEKANEYNSQLLSVGDLFDRGRNDAVIAATLAYFVDQGFDFKLSYSDHDQQKEKYRVWPSSKESLPFLPGENVPDFENCDYDPSDNGGIVETSFLDVGRQKFLERMANKSVFKFLHIFFMSNDEELALSQLVLMTHSLMTIPFLESVKNEFQEFMGEESKEMHDFKKQFSEDDSDMFAVFEAINSAFLSQDDERKVKKQALLIWAEMINAYADICLNLSKKESVFDVTNKNSPLMLRFTDEEGNYCLDQDRLPGFHIVGHCDHPSFPALLGAGSVLAVDSEQSYWYDTLYSSEKNSSKPCKIKWDGSRVVINKSTEEFPWGYISLLENKVPLAKSKERSPAVSPPTPSGKEEGKIPDLKV